MSEPSPRVEPPARPRPSRSNQSNAGTILALFGLLVIAAGLLGLMALVLPQLLGIVLVVGGLFGMVFFHYVVWGWWLSQMKPDDLPEDPK